MSHIVFPSTTEILEFTLNGTLNELVHKIEITKEKTDKNSGHLMKIVEDLKSKVLLEFVGCSQEEICNISLNIHL